MANKNDIIARVAEKLETTKVSATESVNATFETIIELLQEEGKVQVHGFGNFDIRERAARKGRNPQDGTEIDIPASRTVGFKPAKHAKEAIN